MPLSQLNLDLRNAIDVSGASLCVPPCVTNACKTLKLYHFFETSTPFSIKGISDWFPSKKEIISFFILMTFLHGRDLCAGWVGMKDPDEPHT
jgi:hypothetical protein